MNGMNVASPPSYVQTIFIFKKIAQAGCEPV